MTNFCCHDDFNGNGNFDFIDGRIHNAFTTMVLDGNEPTTISELLDGYNSIYTDAPITIQLYPTLALPEKSCADFNLNDNFDFIDGRIYNAFITMVLDGNEPTSVSELLDGYNSIYADAQLTLDDINHLPRLEGDCPPVCPDHICVQYFVDNISANGNYTRDNEWGPINGRPLYTHVNYDPDNANSFAGIYIKWQTYNNAPSRWEMYADSSVINWPPNVDPTEWESIPGVVLIAYDADNADVSCPHLGLNWVERVFENCPECGLSTNYYEILPGNTSPAVDSLSAEWQANWGGGLCYGDIESGIIHTYVAFVENDTTPIGTITITGSFIGDTTITYTTDAGGCYQATPQTEAGIPYDVYRFTSIETSASSITVTADACTWCCDPTMQPVFIEIYDTTATPVANGISAMSFSYRGNLCIGNSMGGTPTNISLYVPDYEFTVGVISVMGVLDSDTIYLEVTDDPYSANGVPEMTGKCLSGTVVGNRCDLTEIT